MLDSSLFEQVNEDVFNLQLDDKQPLEYLSEMRQVSMLFINLMTDETTKIEGCLLLQQCFEVIFTQLKKLGGKFSSSHRV